MEFSLSSEQQMLADMVERFVRDHSGINSSRAWPHMAEFGWLALTVPEEFGGIGGGAVEACLLAQGLGRASLGEPFVTTAVLGARLISRCEPSKRDELLDLLIAGRLKLACARAAGPGEAGLTAAEFEGGYRLDGEVHAVPGAGDADLLAVPALVSCGVRQEIFLVSPEVEGLCLVPYAALDEGLAADLAFDGVVVEPAARIASDPSGDDWFQDCLDHHDAAMMAEAVGAMHDAFDRTVEHLNTRKQFDKYLREFQVLQHRIADMYMALEEARSMAFLAAASLSGTASRPRQVILPAAWVKIISAGTFVIEQSIQLHGGVGITKELGLGNHLRRHMVISTLAGGYEYNLSKLMEAAC